MIQTLDLQAFQQEELRRSRYDWYGVRYDAVQSPDDYDPDRHQDYRDGACLRADKYRITITLHPWEGYTGPKRDLQLDLYETAFNCTVVER